MTPERWQRIEHLFESASALPNDEREAFLATACGEDAELRSEVEAMLAADDSRSFLDAGAAELGAAVLLSQQVNDDPNLGRKIGNYRIVRQIGRGGMGAVYEAVRDDSEFMQRVAIKLIKRGMDTDFILRRFRHERQILADLNHPNIARLLDGGTTDDNLPYFVMEYVDGEPLTKFCDNNLIDVEERLRLFDQVCKALDHAHRQNVIHRDIKPGNILVTRDGRVKLLDFGISKLLDPEQVDDTLDSASGRMMMTPDYASPEQVRGEPATVSSDIYSLGVLLYKLLTGRSPYKGAKRGSHALAWAICEEQPLPPSVNSERTLPAELDPIVLKALEKRRTLRYASAAQMSGDIEAFLDGRTLEPVSQPSGFSSVPGQKTIAVLPFGVITLATGDPSTDESFMGIGLTDAFVTRLANVRGLVVRPTSAVLKYTGNDQDIFNAGRELAVAYVLQGRIVMAGDRLRVTVQLIDIENRASLWASQYDEKFTDIFAVQDSISDQVTRALQFELTQNERENIAKHGTENAAAYELYLRGRAVRHSYSEDAITQAIQYLSRAIEIDPNFAAAHSGIADLHVALGIVSALPPEQAFGTAKTSATRAVELDPNLGEAWASLAFATLVHDWDAEESERLFKISFARNNNFAPAYEWHAHLLASQGLFDQAIEEMTNARRIDPRSCQLNAMTAYVYHTARRHKEGVRYIERAYELEPDNYLALQGFGWMLPPLGRAQEAVEHCRRAVILSNRAPLCLWVLGEVLASLGNIEETRQIIGELMNDQAATYVPPYYVGMLYRAVGEYDEAVAWLNKTVDERSYWAQWFTAEYRLDVLRQHPGFKSILERLRAMKTAALTEEPKTVQTTLQKPEKTGESAPFVRSASYRWWIPAVVVILLALIPLGYSLRSASTRQSGSEPPLLRITKGTNTGNVASAVISSDGSQIAYVTDENGSQSLWVKHLTDADGVPVLSKREGQISSLAFTPDNRQLYYVEQARQSASGTLYRISSAGGEPAPVLNGVYGKVDFSPTGDRMTYRKRTTDPGGDSLLSVSTSGGDAKELAWRYWPGTIGNAAWSPDGQTVAYGASIDGSGGMQAIFLQPADGGTPRKITDEEWDIIPNVDWAQDGQSLYFNAQKHGAGHVQIWRIRIGNGVAESVTNDADNYRGISVGRNVGTIGTVKSELRSNLWIGSLDEGKPDEKTSRRVTGANLAGLFGITWTSSDELLFTVTENAFTELWRTNLAAASPTKVIRTEAYSFMPAISPDGRNVVYVSDVNGANRLWKANIDGTNAQELTHGEEDLSPSYSPDGRWVYYMQTVAGKTCLAKVAVSGGEPVSIGDMAAKDPAISPDGRTLAFLLIEADRTRIALIPSDGTIPNKVFETEIAVAGRAFYSSVLHWSRDGKSIYFIREVDGLSNIWSQPITGGQPIPLTNFSSEEIFYFDVSPDGRSLALSRGAQTSDVVIITPAQR